MSISMEFTPEQIELFSCTNIVHEFEIRLRLAHSTKQGTRYINGVDEKLWNGIVLSLSNDPSFTASKESYTNTNFTLDKEQQHSSPIRERIVGTNKSFISKKTIKEDDITFIGFQLRLSEATEDILKKEEVPLLFKSFQRNINRTTFSKKFSSGNEIKIDCSMVRNTKFRFMPTSKDPVFSKRFEALETTLTWEVELEVKVARSEENFFDEVIPVLKQISIALHENRLPIHSILMQKSKVFEYLSELETNMRIKFDSELRGLAYNLKPFHIRSLSDYAMTNKLDGERKFILVIPNYVFIMNSGGVKETLEHFIAIPHSLEVPTMLIDVEYENGTYYAFDLIYFKSSEKTLLPMNRLSHQERMAMIVSEKVPLSFQIKSFYYGSIVENMQALMKDNPDPNLFFTQNDGIIFTPKLSSYLETHNREHSHLKFKFSSKLSVDFLIDAIEKPSPAFPFQYYLFSNHFQRNQFFKGYKQSTYEGILNSLVPLRKLSVIECILVNGCWVMLRERPDRDQGNRQDVIKDVKDDMSHPISIYQLYGENVIPPLDISYLSILENKNQSYLYDTFFNHLISFSYLTLTQPSYQIDNFMKVLYVFFSKQETLQFHSKVRSIITKSDNLLDSSILNQLLFNDTFPYYQPTELKNVFYIYDSLFKQAKSRSIFDVKHYGILSDTPCIPSHHVIPIHPNVLTDEMKLTEEMISLFQENHFDETVNPKPTARSTQEDFILYEKYSTFFTVPSSNYSVLKPWHESQVKQILSKWFTFPVTSIVDGTAHIGVDSIHLSDQFPEAKIMSFEIVPETVIALRKNIQSFKKEHIIRAHFQDVTGWMPTQPVDLLYLDPPWGGKSYSNYKLLNLYLEKEKEEGESHDGSKNVNVLIDQWMKTNKIYSIVLKAPQNFNMSYLKRNYHVQQETIRNRGGNIAYYLLKIENQDPLLNKPKSKLTLWSVPYYTSLKSIFFNTESVLVQIPTHRDSTLLLLTALQQYCYEPMSYDKPNFINQTVIQQYADENSFELVDPTTLGFKVNPARPYIINNYFDYLLFRKKNVERLEEDSSLVNMRKYHNIEKKTLIQKYSKKKSVLDLGAGAGGDLFKYAEAGITSLIAIEPFEKNLLELNDRLKSTEISGITTIVNCLGQEWDKIQPHLKKRVQVVSSFFSMTFLFESIQILRAFLHTVNESLEEGGVFIGTMMSGEKTYQLLEKLNMNESLPLGPDVRFIKEYNNQPPSTGMKLHIDILNTIVGSQDEYLAFFSILESECKALGLELVQRFDFKPPVKFHLTPIETQFSILNIGFAFQKLPSKFAYPTEIIKPDETFQFINLYKEEQLLIRTGVDSNYSFYRSYLFNLTQDYRSYSKGIEQRNSLISGIFNGFQELMASKQKEIPLDMDLQDLPIFMSSQQINIYVIDSVTRRPIHLDGYDVSRKKSMMMVYHSNQPRFEPLAFNIKGTAKRIFGVLDPHIVFVHRSMKKQK